MPHPVPPHIEAAVDHLKKEIQRVDRLVPDLLSTPWAQIEKSVIKILGGAFQLERPEHQTVALGLSGVLARRLIQEHQAFWFPNRDSPEGASMGFPEAVIMLSPFGAVVESLSHANLARLDELTADIRKSLAHVRFSPDAAAPALAKLDPVSYQRLFDPGFVQFVVMDQARVKETWEATPDKLVRDLRGVLGRNSKLPAELREQVEAQIVATLQRMEAQKPLLEQLDHNSRLVELLGHLFGTVDGTGFAPEEFWEGLVLPLVFIGAPEQFPPLEGEDLEAFKQGVDPLALFVDVVPYQNSAPEDGLLGAIPASEVQPFHPAFAALGGPRLVQLGQGGLGPLLSKFDPAKTKDAIARFTASLEQKAGKAATKGGPGEQMAEAAFILLKDIKRLYEAAAAEGRVLGIRRATEAEASSEGAFTSLREALRGPRLILV